jgi:hypothetical protein
MGLRRALLALGVAAGVTLLIASSDRVLMFLVVMAAVFTPGEITGCEPRQIHAEATSIDGAWIATSYTDTCVQGPFTTVVYDSVEIRGAHEPAPRAPKKAVFAKDSYPSELPLAVTWIAPRILEIRLPNLSSIGKQQTEFADVAIVYKYGPDDPVGRICSKRWSVAMSDARSLERPQPDQGAFFAACRGTAGEQPR